jgi:hypothetical protein
MYQMRAAGLLVGLLFYAAAGLAYHLIAYGDVEWSDAFIYVVMAFWPILLAWEILKVLLLLLVVVLAGLGLYWLVRSLIARLGGRGPG